MEPKYLAFRRFFIHPNHHLTFGDWIPRECMVHLLLVGGGTTHLKNMRKSNWHRFPQSRGENKISLKPQSMYGPFIGSTPPGCQSGPKMTLLFFSRESMSAFISLWYWVRGRCNLSTISTILYLHLTRELSPFPMMTGRRQTWNLCQM